MQVPVRLVAIFDPDVLLLARLSENESERMNLRRCMDPTSQHNTPRADGVIHVLEKTT